MPNRLMVTGIESVGAVDAGDDPEAKVMFWKRKETGGTGDTIGKDDMAEFSLADLPLDETQAAGLDEHIAIVTADAVAKALEDTPDDGDDDILKGLSDEVRDRIDGLEKKAAADEKALAEEVEKRRDAEYVAKAAPFESLIGPAGETGLVLRKLADADPDATGIVLGWFQKIHDQVELADLFKVLGVDDEGDVTVQKETFVKQYAVDHPDAKQGAAEAAFWSANPDAVEASREK